MVIQGNVLKKYYNWVIAGGILLILLIGYLATEKNYYYSMLFYTNRDGTKLLAERRKIIKARTKENRIKNSIEELLLGRSDPDLYNLFPVDSKVLSVRVEKKVVHINLNRETFLNVEDRKSKNGVSIYRLMLQSIVHSIYFQNKWVDRVKFYIEGAEYNYIGDVGPLANGLKPDWSLVK